MVHPNKFAKSFSPRLLNDFQKNYKVYFFVFDDFLLILSLWMVRIQKWFLIKTRVIWWHDGMRMVCYITYYQRMLFFQEVDNFSKAFVDALVHNYWSCHMWLSKLQKSYILIFKTKWFLMQCDAISTFMMSLEDAKLDHAHDSNAISLKMCTNYMPTDILILWTTKVS